MNKLNKTRQQGTRTLIAISVIAVAVYIGFEPLIKFVPDGVAKSVISASFGAIFVIILTMYLLNKQTEIEQESKKSERVFDEKVKLYQMILDIVRDMMMDGKISKEEINKLPFPLIRLGMLGKDETIESFKAVNNELNKIYSEKDDEVVILKDDDKQRVYELLAKFASKCRSDLEIGDEVQDQFIKTTVATITSTGKKKRDYTKYSFNGKEYPKNQYVYHVIKTFFDENPDISLEDFPKRVIERTPIEFDGDRKNDYETWKTYDQAIEVYQRTGKKRYFVTKRGGDYLKDKDLVLKLADAEICISNQWGLPNMEIFKEIMNSKGIRTE